MKKAVLTFAILFILTSGFAQKTEFRLGLNSGLFSFGGRSAESVSSINSTIYLGSGTKNNSYTNNPYGSQNALCYGISGNLKRVSKKNFIYGVDLGYERLRSKVTISQVNDNSDIGIGGIAFLQYPASGKTYLNFSFINIHPFAGYRLALQPVHVDITGGVDIGRCLQAKEKGSAEASNGRAFKTSVDRKTITTDIRPRVQLSAGYKKFGVYVGYSKGLINYKEDYAGGTFESYSKIFRFGVAYQLK